MPGVREAREKIETALDIKDRVAEHQDRDRFTHHVHAPLVEAAHEITDLDGVFQATKPSKESLDKALDAKERMARYGVVVSEEDQLWHEELDEGVKELERSQIKAD